MNEAFLAQFIPQGGAHLCATTLLNNKYSTSKSDITAFSYSSIKLRLKY